MRLKLASVLIGSLLTCQVHAATWYGFTHMGKESVYFFDFDTVLKEKGSVTLWIKLVRLTPDQDGAYSVALKQTYSCAKRTIQTLTFVDYDKGRNVLRHVDTAEKPTDVVPGTLAEIQFEKICASTFPKAKAREYVRVAGNDIYAAAERLLNPADPAPQ